MKKSIVNIIGVLVLLLGYQCSLAQTNEFRYAVFDLGDFGGSASNAFGINDAGIVVGNAWFPGNFIFHTALFDVNKGTITDLGTLGGQTSWAYEINELGQIVGVSDDITNVRHAYLLQDGLFNDLGSLGGPEAWANSINDKGQVIGFSQLSNLQLFHAFKWNNGIMTDLGSLLDNQATSDAWDINEAGQVVGWSYNESTETAILWDNGEMIDLGGLCGNCINEARAINDLGHVVGFSAGAGNQGFKRAVLWEGGRIHNLQAGNNSIFASFAWGINNQDQVVGYALIKNKNELFGTIWDPINGMQLLDNLLPNNPDMNVYEAFDINENGQIAAWGLLKQGGWFRALMLSPVDPEMVLSDPVPGVAGVVNSWTVTGAAPGAKVTFVYGFKGGGTRVPGCDVLDAAVQIDEPRVVKTVVADGGGVATLDMLVPSGAKGLGGILVQAVSLDVCQESQLTVVNFE